MSNSMCLDKPGFWKSHNVAQDQFFAAAYFMETIRRQRGQLPDSLQWRTETNPEDQGINIFLDRLAILFACLKNDSKKTPEHVTATGLVTSKPADDETTGTRSVYIAKNNGLKDREKKFMDKLNKWLADDVSDLDSALSHENAPWIAILRFWSDRIRFYAGKIGKLLPKLDEVKEFNKRYDQQEKHNYDASYLGWYENVLPRDIQDGWWEDVGKSGAHNATLRINQQDLAAKEQLVSWWKETLKLASEVAECKHFHIFNTTDAPQYCSEKGEVLFEIFKRCYEFRHHRDSQHSDPLHFFQVPRASEQLPLTLYKVIHYLEMLGLPWSIWQTFARFRKDCQMSKLAIEVKHLEAPSPKKMPRQQLVDTIESWEGIKSSEECQNVVASLKQGKDFTRYVHCEIQMVQHLEFKIDFGKKHYYIGCSKRSCELCWQVLRNQDYRTESSHHKISANWEIPDDVPAKLDFVPRELRRVHKEWMEIIRDSAHGLWTESYPVIADTQPIPSQPAALNRPTSRPVLPVEPAPSLTQAPPLSTFS